MSNATQRSGAAVEEGLSLPVGSASALDSAGTLPRESWRRTSGAGSEIRSAERKLGEGGSGAGRWLGIERRRFWRPRCNTKRSTCTANNYWRV